MAKQVNTLRKFISEVTILSDLRKDLLDSNSVYRLF